MFRLAGLAEEAGTGMAKILRSWRELGFQLPAVEVGPERYEFKLTLRHAHLLDDEDRLWLGSMGDAWSEAEQLALVWARREGEIDNVTLRHLTGQHAADASRVLVGLRDRGLLQKLGVKRGARYQLGAVAAEAASLETVPAVVANVQGSDASPVHNGGSPEHSEPSSVHRGTSPEHRTGQVQARLAAISAEARTHSRLSPEALADTVIRLCTEAPLTRDELAELLHRNEGHIRRVIRPLLAEGRLNYLYPEQPSHPRQRYVTPGRDDEEEPAF
jgi:ATP-dependent DNA helicase RecG